MVPSRQYCLCALALVALTHFTPLTDAACAEMPGYIVLENTDHAGDDIGKAATASAAMAKCTATPACKGFNSLGYYKRVVAPIRTASGTCLYTKECPPFANFIPFPNTDHWYDDIGQANSPVEAMSRCSSNSNCKGFNSQGWYKTVTSSTSKLTGVCLYTKRNSCPEVSGYTVTPLADHAGDDIGRAASFQDAIDMCNANPACKGFTSLGWYKRTVTPTQAHEAACLYAKAAPPPTCTLLWSDDFSGSTLDRSNWNYWEGTAYNNELQYYTSRTQNVRLSNGNLVIEARAESFGGSLYTSGRIDTNNKRVFYPGMLVRGRTYSKIRIEARIKLPQGQGFWPAFWMLSNASCSDCEGPYGSESRSGEIDILETVNDMSTAYFTIHYMVNNKHDQKSMESPLSDTLMSQWHTYAVEWLPTQMTWLVDGVAKGIVRSSSVDPNGWRTTSTTSKPTGPNSPFDVPFYVIFNFAVGGDWPGEPNSGTVFPAQMLVDYVRVTGC